MQIFLVTNLSWQLAVVLLHVSGWLLLWSLLLFAKLCSQEKRGPPRFGLVKKAGKCLPTLPGIFQHATSLAPAIPPHKPFLVVAFLDCQGLLHIKVM